VQILKNSLGKEPLVSVIMNCHNGEKYLNRSIRSVLDQTYKNWEIIFFDNNSKDKSCIILKKYKDKRIKYYKSMKLHTLYKARNLAIKKSKGKLISFLDVDDWWIKNKLNKQVNIFLKNKNIEVVYSNLFLYYQNKKKKIIYVKKKVNSGKITQNLVDKFEMPILTTIMKKNLFKKIKFDNRYTIIGDFDFFIRLSTLTSIKAIQEPLAYYRIHDSNLTTNKIDLNIKELEIWIKEKIKSKKFELINFSKVYERIQILKITYNLKKNNKILALIELFKRPFSFLKVKSLIYFIAKNF
jgi:glycosyltransferase involved in cell wall biosynthesis